MHRNHNKGVAGDSINATLSAPGFNLGKLPAFFLRLHLGRVFDLRFAGFRTCRPNSIFAPA